MMKYGISLIGLALALVFGHTLVTTLAHPPFTRGQLIAPLVPFSIGLLLVEGVASTLASALTALGAAVAPYLKYLPWMKGGS